MSIAPDYYSIREQQGENCARDLLTTTGITHGPRITGMRNRTDGDFPAGIEIIELKTQPLDPTRFSHFFVSVLKVKEWQDDLELELAARSLALSVPALTKGTSLTPDTNMRFALRPATNGAWYWYVSPDPPTPRIYMFSGARLLQHVRDQVVRGGLVNRPGNASYGTYGVFVPNPVRWWEKRDGVWQAVRS